MTRSPADTPDLFSPEQLADYLGLPSVNVVYGWRTKNYGPAGFRVGKHTRFRRVVVDAWIAAQEAADPSSPDRNPLNRRPQPRRPRTRPA